MKRGSKHFDIQVLRRREIERHARYIGAAATDDFYRWLVAWLWHLPKSSDRIFAVQNAADRMGRPGMSEIEAADIIEQARTTRRCRTADNLAGFLGVTFAQREELHLTTIGSVNVGKQPKDEAEHFVRCPACQGWIDCRDLGQVLEHEGPLPHPSED